MRKAFGELQGERLQRVPRGYDPDHPAADFLRLKQYYFRTSLPATLATSRALPKLASRFKAAAPFVRQLDAAHGGIRGWHRVQRDDSRRW